MLKMYHQKNLYIVFAFLLFIYPTAQASSASTVDNSTWQGSYLGIYFGEGFGNNHVSTNAGNVTASSYFATSADVNAVNSAGSWSNTSSTPIIGAQAGHDWAWNQLVFGAVVDYGALPLNSSNNVNNVTYPDNADQYSVHTAISTNWLFTLRGRIGYQVTRPWSSLIYLTGGPALTQLKVSNSFMDNSSYSGVGSSQTSENKIGWTAGAGIELASTSHTSISLEYLYLHVPSVDTTGSISNTAGGFGVPVNSLNNPFTTNGQLHANLLKLEWNYRFDV